MTLYETIFQRRAVRKYDMTPLPEETLGEIKEFLTGIKQLPNTEAIFELVSGTAVKDGKAPHYILAYCPKGAAEYINVGYTMQAADLYIQSLDLGSVWLGMPRPVEKEATEGFCIMLAFGHTEQPFRQTEVEFNRLPLEEITNNFNDVAAAVRLAPSAVNSQPWQLKFGKDNTVTVQYKGRGLMKAFLRGKMSHIDIGIASRHAELALQANGNTIKSITPVITDEKNFSVEIDYN